MNNPALWDGILYKPSGIWTKSFTSSDQTVTAAGLLTLAHGMGVQPKSIILAIVCQTAEQGYSIGDVVYIANYGNGGKGFGIYADTTNINIRFNLDAATLSGHHKTTGAQVTFTNVNWKLRVFAGA
jgi:hypothetical protein